MMDTSRSSSLRSDLNFVTSGATTVLGANWYERYTAYMTGAVEYDPDELILDILRDICDDTLPESVLIHSIALLEENIFNLDREETIEQAIGSLLNIYISARHQIKKRLLVSITTLFTCRYDQVQSSAVLRALLNDFLETLVGTAIKMSFDVSLAITANECLRILEENIPGILRKRYEDGRINSSSVFLMTTLYCNKTELSSMDIRILTDSMNKLPPMALQHILNKFLSVLRTDQTVTGFSPIMFKQFFRDFSLSSEVCQLHFLLLLMKFYDLELFSSSEEVTILSQLVNAAVHPSLMIAQRLMLLDFTKSLVPYLQRSNLLNPLKFELQPFDGPDTQEKKLSLLSLTALQDADLLIKLKPVQTSGSIHGNKRAVNSLYRLLQCFIKRRPTMNEAISAIVVSLIFSLPKNHIRHSLSLLTANDELVPRVCSNFLEEIYSFENDEDDDLKEIYVACEWIIASDYLKDDDASLCTLLNYLNEKCHQHVKLVPYLLSCSAAAIRTHNITDENRKVLKRTLDFVSQECQNNVAISSWAQIYSIAINTLSESENLQKVFGADVDDHGEELFTVLNGSENSLVQLCRVNEDRVSSLNCPEALDVQFTVSLRDSDDHAVNRAFGLTISATCRAHQVKENASIAILKVNQPQVITIKLNVQEPVPFKLYFDCQFNNVNGSSFFCDHMHEENIHFRDFFIPCSLRKSFKDTWSHISTSENSMQSIISLKHIRSTSHFMETYQWTSQYFVSDNELAFHVMPGHQVLMFLQPIDDFLNLHLISDDYSFLDLLYNEFVK
ncbi:hypothetical protein HDE_02365 [Halotydeus destructor]|nr:hypothetical protein HDE_02365 [Halotydeus destructor]